MIKIAKFLFALLSVAVIAGAWVMYTTIAPRLDAEQKQLSEDSDEYLSRKIYDVGIDLVNRALQIDTDRNANLWRKLADAYSASGDSAQYRSTLQIMISGGILPDGEKLEDLYLELYRQQQLDRPPKETLALLKEGIRKTDSDRLREIYGAERWQTVDGRYTFDEAYVLTGGTGLVRIEENWGYVGSSGSMIIRPSFELATNFAASGRDVYAVVYKNGELFVINRSGLRRALADEYAGLEVEELARFTGKHFSAKLPGQNDFAIFEWGDGLLSGYLQPVIAQLENRYEFYGLTSDGLTAVKADGAWHIRGSETIARDRSFDEIAVDELGRCTAPGAGALFVKTGGSYNMIGYDGSQIAGPFEDAKPFFSQDGWAAVKNNGKWGFADASGKLVIDYIYEDANSSSGITAGISEEILAPVRQDGLWGYIKTDGAFAIPPQYDDAKQFVNGCAPVKKEAVGGWFYILLAEYAP